jgi:hypothetical protein
MKHLNLYLVTVAVVLISLIGVASAAHAAPHATYRLVRSSIVPGGSGSAGIYKVASSIGQPDAGEVNAGIYTLGGGFWGGGVIVSAQADYSLFLSLVLK